MKYDTVTAALIFVFTLSGLFAAGIGMGLIISEVADWAEARAEKRARRNAARRN